MKSTIRYPHAVSSKVFWEKVFFNEGYQDRLHKEVLGASDFELIEQTGDVDSGVHRRIRFSMAMDVPGPLKKFVGEGFSSAEDGRYDPATNTFTYAVTPSAMADKLTIGGTMQTVDQPDGTLERIIVLDTKAKILGLGKVIESFIDQSVKDSHVKVRAFTDQWIKDQGLS